ncbi:signal peptidase I [Lysinibacter cavernae]|uniref:Signal peptidase I n=1 Tax=Lysinibacter cavernae TaxID=1640652 RepID=A0A7X5R0Z9_9MICO|nr:signal peptidase I [Lysinibacter cavernae]NIH53447.1 signal peptidase [Lysinibacter cavernae]
MTAHRIQPRHGRTGHSGMARIGSIGLTLASFAGLMCLVLVAVALVFKITLIMFSTGSMSPTIPAGSVAVVKEIPASEIRVGDVVTVDRQDQLPITHRVTSVVSASGGEAGATTFTMQGDANAVPDVAPYTATRARLVLFSVPGLAPFIVAASQPLVLGTISLAAAALITWAFWPREHAQRGGRYLASRRSRQASAHRDTEPATSGIAAVIGGGLVLVIALVPVLGVPVRAHAALHEEVIAGKWITLTSIGDRDLMGDITDGAVVPWQVGVSSTAKESGRISIALAASGTVTSGLDVRIRVCNTRWVDGACSGVEREVLPQRDVSLVPAVRNVREHMLTTMSPDTERWLLVEVSAPDDLGTGGSTVLSVHAWGSGDSVATPVLPGIPGSSGGSSVGGDRRADAGRLTGTGIVPFLLAPVAAAIGVGAVAFIARGRHRGAHRSDARRSGSS